MFGKKRETVQIKKINSYFLSIIWFQKMSKNKEKVRYYFIQPATPRSNGPYNDLCSPLLGAG